MAGPRLTPALFTIIATRFKALAEPARLAILDALRGGEMTVTDLIGKTGLGQANLSKHLQLLRAEGFVKRRKDGLFTYYAVADRDVFKLCDAMCGHLEAEMAARRKLVRSR